MPDIISDSAIEFEFPRFFTAFNGDLNVSTAVDNILFPIPDAIWEILP